MPYCVLGGVLASVSNGAFSTLSRKSTVGQWVGFQIINGVGRGTSTQMASHQLTLLEAVLT
jgi:hypothetical protein